MRDAPELAVLRHQLAAGSERYPGTCDPDGSMAYARLVDTVNPPDDVRARCRRVIDLMYRSARRHSRRHEAWLSGGCHPLGTPARDAQDRARKARYERGRLRREALGRGIEALLAGSAP